MPATAGNDRREHPRQAVRAYAQVIHARRGWDVHLLDMSFSGARIAMGAAYHSLTEGDEVNLTVELDEIHHPDIGDLMQNQTQKSLRLRGTLVYLKDQVVGVEYRPLSEVDHVLLTLLLARPED